MIACLSEFEELIDSGIDTKLVQKKPKFSRGDVISLASFFLDSWYGFLSLIEGNFDDWAELFVDVSIAFA